MTIAMDRKDQYIPAAPRRVIGGTVNQQKICNVGYRAKRSTLKMKENEKDNR